MRNFSFFQSATVKVRHPLEVLFAIIMILAMPVKLLAKEIPLDAPPDFSESIAIQSINPGYTIDGQANTGESIELRNLSLEPIDLTDFYLEYINSSGNTSILYEFSDGAIFAGEIILLRYAKSPEVINATSTVADDTYSKTLAFSGAISLKYQDQTISTVCWTGKAGCLKSFQSSKPTAIVRSEVELEDAEIFEFLHQPEYQLLYDPEFPGLQLPSSAEDEDVPVITEDTISLCQGLMITEILSYFDISSTEQFIEIFNDSKDQILLANCSLKYKNKLYVLPDAELSPEEYFIFYPEVTLTKNPSSENILEIVDQNGEPVYQMAYPHGQKKSTTYAFFGLNSHGQEIWMITYHPTPGSANVYQEYRTCPSGKIINKTTGNCINAATLSATIEPCPAGKYRNPATGRCKKIEENSVAECKAGYERNPETGRCRKIKNNSAAEHSLVPVTGVSEKSSFVAVWILIVVCVVGVIFIIFQFRKEIWYFFRKFFHRKA